MVTQVDGRGVYSFCMCPGGFVIPAATGPEQIVTNGMDMMNFSTYLQQISIGAMLLIVLAFRHRKRH